MSDSSSAPQSSAQQSSARPTAAPSGAVPSSAELARALSEALTDGDAVVTERSDLVRYEKGWRYGEGRALLACRPRTTEEVASVVRVCRAHGAPVLPAGANTGLVAASTPDSSGTMVVLSLERLNARIEIDEANGSVLVDGGVLLSELNGRLAEHGLVFPIDLGADPQIGGMIVTNTGGSRLVKYGDVRANLLGIEAVLPDGRVFSYLKALRKNNTGLDAKQLFVGTSGVPGIVTAAVLRTWRWPTQTAGALVRATSGEAVVRLFGALERSAGDLVTAFEAMSSGAVEAVQRHGSLERDPFGGAAPAYAVLVELSTTLPTATLDLDEALGGALEAAFEADPEGIEDVVLGDVADFWHVRHQISESLREEGFVLGLDVSVPRSSMARFTDDVRASLAASHPFVRVCDFGHWGDGGSHLNLVWDPAATPDPAATKAELQALVYERCVTGFGGSYSAEHGVGPHNESAYARYTDAWVREVVQRVAPEPFGTVRL
ncbi:MAG: FAD-binding oxidoreductase [Planctomycetota bacterium]